MHEQEPSNNSSRRSLSSDEIDQRLLRTQASFTRTDSTAASAQAIELRQEQSNRGLRRSNLDLSKAICTGSSRSNRAASAETLAKISFRPTEKRKTGFRHLLRECKRLNRTSGHTAQVLLGKLTFCLQSAAARIGRAATLPLVERARTDNCSSPTSNRKQEKSPRMLAGMHVRVLSPTQSAPDDERKSLTRGVFRVTKVMQDANNSLVELKVRHDGDSLYKVALPADEVQTVRSKQRNRAFDYMLEFFETLFSGFPPLVFRCAEEPTSPVLMYTDASRSPTLRRTRSRSHRHSVQSSLHIRSAGKVWLFVDNTAAISATAHGYTASPFLGPLSNAVQFALAFLRCDLRREYVPTDTNPADIPSRDPAERSEKCKQVLVDIKVSKPDSNRRMVLPEISDLVSPLAVKRAIETRCST